jgi:pimeloyl-ACP methyl ester carboxylesterase
MRMTDLPTTESQQYGCRRLDFDVPGGRGYVILPDTPSRESEYPWLWYAPSFIEKPWPLPKGLHAWYMTRWLAKGIAIGGVDVGESWGSPAGRAGFTEYYRVAVSQFGLDPKACMLGQSRGGLFVYNWASEHPAAVRCICGIYPMCTVCLPEIPEALRKDYGLPKAIRDAYGLTPEELLAAGDQHDPLQRLAPLVEAGVPIFHVHGDADEIVPLDRNSEELVRRYRELGGKAELLVLEGKGHQEITPFFRCPAVLDFVLQQAGAKRMAK